MKELDRYLMREMWTPFGIGLTAFLTVLCLNMAYFVINLIVEKGAPLRDILQLIVLRVPFFLVLALPVAVLLAVSMAVNRLTRDRELIALRMAGVSLWRLLLPYALFGLFLTGISFCAQEWFAPLATHKSDSLYRRLLVESSVPSLMPGSFFRADNRVFYFHQSYRVGERTVKLEQVIMFQLNNSNFPDILTAREALVEGDQWTLKGVVLHHLDDQGKAQLDAVSRDDLKLDLRKDIGAIVDSQPLSEELTAAQMREQIHYYHKLNIGGAFLSQLEYDYYSKYSLPMACLICALIGVPLNIRYARLGGLMGLFLALVAVFIYYNFMVIARSFAENGTMSGVVAAWLPDVIFGVVCLVFIVRER